MMAARAVTTGTASVICTGSRRSGGRWASPRGRQIPRACASRRAALAPTMLRGSALSITSVGAPGSHVTQISGVALTGPRRCAMRAAASNALPANCGCRRIGSQRIGQRLIACKSSAAPATTWHAIGRSMACCRTTLPGSCASRRTAAPYARAISLAGIPSTTTILAAQAGAHAGNASAASCATDATLVSERSRTNKRRCLRRYLTSRGRREIARRGGA